jgi:hydroxyquinol 1,2-dioxygenase
MRDLDENTITDAVLSAVGGAAEPRVRRLSEALVRHLHAFIREVEPTEAEWEAGIRFLTQTGQMCSETRQEFILLSDTLGVSMLVDAINHRQPSNATPTTVLGPFYVSPPAHRNGEAIHGNLPGTPLYLSGTVSDPNGTPIADAVVDVWHSDQDGFYDLQKLEEHPDYAARGRFRTDAQGRFHLWTIRPAPYPIPADGPVGRMLERQGRHPYRPEHVHFVVEAPGCRRLVTHLFAEGDAYLGSDVVFGVKQALVRPYTAHEGGQAPDGRSMVGPWYSLEHDFRLAPALSVSGQER